MQSCLLFWGFRLFLLNVNGMLNRHGFRLLLLNVKGMLNRHWVRLRSFNLDRMLLLDWLRLLCLNTNRVLELFWVRLIHLNVHNLIIRRSIVHCFVDKLINFFRVLRLEVNFELALGLRLFINF